MTSFRKNTFQGLSLLKTPKNVKFKESFKMGVLANCIYDILDTNPIKRLFVEKNKDLTKNIKCVSEGIIKLARDNHDSLIKAVEYENIAFRPTVLLYGHNITFFIIPISSKLLVGNEKSIKAYEIFGCDDASLSFYQTFLIEKDDNGRNNICLFKNPYVSGDYNIKVAQHLASLVIDLLLFLNYAKTETIYLNGKSKKNIGNSVNREILSNDSNFAIQFIDSSWAREYVRTEGFDVRGFFRLQPYKDGRKQLIYIAPFHKNGYHRRARKDLQCNCV